MDKNAIKKYATWARRELISRVSQKAEFYGVTAEEYGDFHAASIDGRVLSPTEKMQRQALIDKVRSEGYEQAMEEVAYTWFNRFSALRYMEVNNYLPTRVRVFTNENGEFKPQIIDEAIHLELDGLDMEKVYSLKDANDTEALYRYLLITQCNALSKIMPVMFQRISDYTELLLPDYLLREGSVIEQMVTSIPEEDWTDQVQIIGWLYQYYNAEKKDEVFAALKKNVKITKENIPAATQLFTPDWIVRYMVENSLGRLWVEGHPNEQLKSGWKYYLEEAEQEADVEAQLAEIRKEYAALKPEEILCIDPCAGSGHILDYLFDILMQIYTDYGYTTSEAVRSIVENNLYGLDIDERAAQLAYFSVMMKARSYDRRFLTRKDEDGNPDIPQPHVYAIVESNHLNQLDIEYFTNNDPKLKKDFGVLVDKLHDAKEYGSILNISQVDFAALYARIDEIRSDISMYKESTLMTILPLIQVAEALAQKYHVVVTNPPYMGSSSMGAKLGKYVKDNYPDSKSDLFAVFIERCGSMTTQNGYQAMITQHAWMFLSSFEKLRGKLLQKDTINMAHLGARAFEEIGGEVVQTTSFVRRSSHITNYKGTYCRLIEPSTQQGKEDLFLTGEKRYVAQQDNFSKIPGTQVAYWASKKLVNLFELSRISDYVSLRSGLGCGDNDRFMRNWFEVSQSEFMYGAKSPNEALNSGKKWFPYNKGGEYRKHYGNRQLVLRYDKFAFNIMCTIGNKLPSRDLYFSPMSSWTDVSTGNISLRYYDSGFLFGTAGPALFSDKDHRIIIAQALLNSTFAREILKLVSPSIHFNPGDVALVPALGQIFDSNVIERIERNNIEISRTDWDSFETSWDFQYHPLVSRRGPREQTNQEKLEEEFLSLNNLHGFEELRKFISKPSNYTAKNYINSYFSYLSKNDLLSFEMYEESRFGKRDAHMLSAYLLGHCLQQNMQKMFPPSLGTSHEHDFEYLWFLTCLYHDAFSEDVEKDVSDIRCINDIWKYEKSVVHYTIYDREICGVALPKPIYNEQDVGSYFLYRLEGGKVDHGIRGGYIAFHRLVENYIQTRTEHENQDEFYTDENGHKLFWSKKQINAFAYVANAIIAHNIWFASEEDKEKYANAGLQRFVDGKKLSFEEQPLAYLLAVVDTIEPLKHFMPDRNENENEGLRNREVDIRDIFNSITIEMHDFQLIIGKVPDSNLDLEQWHIKKMKDMSRWLDGIDTEYKPGSDKIYIRFASKISNKFTAWKSECEDRFQQLKSNEEKLNRVFIDIYRLQDELSPEVEDKDVTVRLADKSRDIRSLISYAVGCMFGRYSLDVDRLAYAGGEWDASKYSTYIPDKDGIIPICDDEYFDDDIVNRFVDFVRIVYGKETLEENLKFIADVLGGKGAPRQVIRDYFMNDFYADHLKVYQKRPIYWLFDSGKKNGFKCLIYIHRYKPDTIARIRTDYVHEQQARYRTAIAGLENQIANAGTGERVKLNKQLKKLQDQADELHGYEEKIHHLADQFISIDLDDGVKHNYEIFKDVLAKIK